MTKGLSFNIARHFQWILVEYKVLHGGHAHLHCCIVTWKHVQPLPAWCTPIMAISNPAVPLLRFLIVMWSINMSLPPSTSIEMMSRRFQSSSTTRDFTTVSLSPFVMCLNAHCLQKEFHSRKQMPRVNYHNCPVHSHNTYCFQEATWQYAESRSEKKDKMERVYLCCPQKFLSVLYVLKPFLASSYREALMKIKTEPPGWLWTTLGVFIYFSLRYYYFISSGDIMYFISASYSIINSLSSYGL